MTIITLKTGENIKLDWSFNTSMLLDEYEGGVKTFEKDIKNPRNRLKAYGHLVYAVIASNVDDVLTVKQAQRLIGNDQTERINKFLQLNEEKVDAFQKKQTSSSTTTRKRKKKKQTIQK